MVEFQKHAEWKKSSAKEHTLDNSIYMKFRRSKLPYHDGNQDGDCSFMHREVGLTIKGHMRAFWSDGNIPNLDKEVD